MKVLVTGANGFVGRPLCASLVERGITLRSVVRDPSDPVAGTPLVVGDLGEVDWNNKLDGVDTIIHLAARVHIMSDSASNPITEYRSVNVDATVRLAEAAVRAGVRRFLYLSSIKVNGEKTLSQPFSVHDTPAPADPYSKSKWEAELALWQIAESTGLEVVVIRPPLVYGPYIKANFMNLLRLLSKGLPLPLASVDNSRSMIYVGNLIDAIICCVESANAAGNTFLVSDGEALSTPALIRELSRLLGIPSRVVHCPPSILKLVGRLSGKANIVERLTESLVVDNSHVQDTLGWLPPYTVAQGLMATVDWYRADFLTVES